MENIPCKPDIKKWVSCSIEQFYDSLKTNPEGLSTNDADQRLQEHGYNVLPEKKKRRLYRKLLTQFKNLI
jgi:Ca2+-transporting ATPase